MKGKREPRPIPSVLKLQRLKYCYNTLHFKGIFVGIRKTCFAPQISKLHTCSAVEGRDGDGFQSSTQAAILLTTPPKTRKEDKK